MRRLRLAGPLHSARFERWPALEPFQPCDLRTLGRYRLLQGRHLAQQPDDKRLQFSRGECVEVTRWSHPSRESEASVSGKRKPRCRHPFCRCYRVLTEPFVPALAAWPGTLTRTLTLAPRPTPN